ncbi:hypothetical protein HPP92_006794 [Vanilla planifolia]|uniref:Uncharacterized protein n=1 Tax=Vanilla planifolia TaxID=51239 RepID=A0A835RKK7_VANPL|nr:hypothetical protein HPP92_006794 [Vanilla planifolia]
MLKPAVAIEMPIDADEVLEPAVVSPQPPQALLGTSLAAVMFHTRVPQYGHRIRISRSTRLRTRNARVSDRTKEQTTPR